jgi:hypothetical protein
MLKRWHEKTFHQAGQPLAVKLKALSFSEGPEYLRKMMAVSRAAQAAQKDAASVESIFTALDPEWVKSVFTRWVRPVAPIEIEEGAAIETGEALFEVVSPGIAVAVLFEIQKLAMLTEAEGKASSSPSTSEPAGMSGAGGSPATSTGSGDGPTP